MTSERNSHSSLARIGVVFRKEVMDNLRDRRSVVSAMMSGLIGPALILILIVILGKTVFADITESTLQIPLLGKEHAPTLVQFLEQNGVVVLPPPDDPQEEVRSGNYDVILIIPEGYGKEFSQGNPVTVQVVVDTSRQSALGKIERVRSLLDGYSRQTAVQRLMARGVSPSVITPLLLERVDVSTPQTQVLMFMNMMPYFVIMVIFLGGMYVIIDTTAGERERGSLEPLLINPVARWEFVIGKLFSALPFAIFTVIFTLAAFAIAFNAFPLEDYIGFQMSIDLGALVRIFLLSLPMVVLASALQMIIATFTRSFKEAQTYVSFLPLIPALPGIGLAFLPIKPSISAMLIPTFGQQLLINQLMRGEPVSPTHLAVSTVATLALALIFIFIAIRLYQRELILFGTR